MSQNGAKEATGERWSIEVNRLEDEATGVADDRHCEDQGFDRKTVRNRPAPRVGAKASAAGRGVKRCRDQGRLTSRSNTPKGSDALAFLSKTDRQDG